MALFGQILYLFFIGITMILYSCHVNDRLEEALVQSGSNRPELEKVLRHYSHSSSDSLHLKAAVYLIENMPGHYGWEGERMSQYIKDIDSIYPGMSNAVKRVLYTIPQRNGSDRSGMRKVYDIDHITAEFLIAHIDNVMDMWNECPWLESFRFDECCEYLLPYRFAEEPLIQQLDSSRYWWKRILEESRYYRNFPYKMDDLRSFQRLLVGKEHDIYMENLQTPSLHTKTHTFDCLDHCFYNISMMRAAGIPCAIDRVPDWPTRNGRHYWRVLIEPSSLYRMKADQQNPIAAKVYRYSYSSQKVPHSKKGLDEYIPELFLSPFQVDVTELYVNTSDIEIRLPKDINTPSLLYLAVFNDLQWKPVAWATIHHRKAVFKNMGRDIVYLPVFFDKNAKLCHAGYPILLDVNGQVKEFKPSTLTHDMTITRKYPLNKDKWFIRHFE